MEVWVRQELKPKLWSRGRQLFLMKKSNINKILTVRLEGLYLARNKVGYSFGSHTLGRLLGMTIDMCCGLYMR